MRFKEHVTISSGSSIEKQNREMAVDTSHASRFLAMFVTTQAGEKEFKTLSDADLRL